MFIRNAVYASLRNAIPPASLLERTMQLNLIQAMLYLALVYVPILAFAGVALSGRGPSGPASSLAHYRTHLAVLFPLWGELLALSAPVQVLVPHWIILGEVGISRAPPISTFMTN